MIQAKTLFVVNQTWVNKYGSYKWLGNKQIFQNLRAVVEQ